MRADPYPRPRARCRGARRAVQALLAVLLTACSTENVTEVVVVSVTVQPGNAALEPGGTVAFEAVVADAAGDAQVGAQVVWSSDTPDVVSVTQTGIARALLTGAATVAATYRGMTGSATVLVIPGPSILLDPAGLAMAGDVRGGGPTRETVGVRNGGLGRLAGLTAEVGYESGGSGGWLTATLSADTTPATLTLESDVERLRAGVYDAFVVVTSGADGGLSASLPVRLSLAGVTVRQTGDATTVEESGSADTFSVVLDLDPGADVRLSVRAEDPDLIDVSPSTLTFTTTTWSTPRTVTVTALDDRVVQGDRTTDITVSVEEAEGTPYPVVTDRSIQVTVEDDDVAGFLVTETEGWTSAREGGHTDTLFVVLTAEPLSDVVFSASTDDPDDAILAPDRLTFTPLTWDDPQILIFRAIDDDRRDGFGFRTLTVAVDRTRSDAAFHRLSRTIDATTLDGDRSGRPASERRRH